ncbi:uncharacterized protein LOC108858077 [Raphanus sativus]|uniref:Uncharacterized protein LOC108858077 n=1 Tax=Raphanus sativus TaxID=3726 RepID=A0A6J0NS99_RAPSA|nr:uncharacterized protein LOC108858077 [Raphanus sativus]
MNPEPNQRQCAACQELEPPFILTVIKGNLLRRLCPDCLLKEHRNLFCPVCLDVYATVPPPQASITCLRCSSTTHLNCAPPPSPSSSSSSSSSSSDGHLFTCPPCFDPNFSFFPKSLATSSTQNEAALGMEKAKALVAAAEIAVALAKNVAEKLEEEAVRKSIEAKDAKEKAKEALVYLEDVKDIASGKTNPRKRKADDRR